MKKIFPYVLILLLTVICVTAWDNNYYTKDKKGNIFRVYLERQYIGLIPSAEYKMTVYTATPDKISGGIDQSEWTIYRDYKDETVTNIPRVISKLDSMSNYPVYSDKGSKTDEDGFIRDDEENTHTLGDTSQYYNPITEEVNIWQQNQRLNTIPYDQSEIKKNSQPDPPTPEIQIPTPPDELTEDQKINQWNAENGERKAVENYLRAAGRDSELEGLFSDPVRLKALQKELNGLMGDDQTKLAVDGFIGPATASVLNAQTEKLNQQAAQENNDAIAGETVIPEMSNLNLINLQGNAFILDSTGDKIGETSYQYSITSSNDGTKYFIDSLGNVIGEQLKDKDAKLYTQGVIPGTARLLQDDINVINNEVFYTSRAPGNSVFTPPKSELNTFDETSFRASNTEHFITVDDEQVCIEDLNNGFESRSIYLSDDGAYTFETIVEPSSAFYSAINNPIEVDGYYTVNFLEIDPETGIYLNHNSPFNGKQIVLENGEWEFSDPEYRQAVSNFENVQTTDQTEIWIDGKSYDLDQYRRDNPNAKLYETPDGLITTKQESQPSDIHIEYHHTMSPMDGSGDIYYFDKENNLLGVSNDEGFVPISEMKPEEITARGLNKVIEFSIEQQQKYDRPWWVGFDEYTKTAAQYTGYYTAVSSLFSPPGWMDDWVRFMDNEFSRYMGLDSWISLACEASYDIEPDNFAMINNRGMITAGAHVEGDRSSRISYGFFNQTTEEQQFASKYLYKISYFLTNPSNNGIDVKFNIVLKPGNVELYNGYVSLEPGQEEGLTAESMFVQYSENYYDEVCIRFLDDTYITKNNGRKLEGDFCNSLSHEFDALEWDGTSNSNSAGSTREREADGFNTV